MLKEFTIIIVNTVLKTCSKLCDLAVTVIFSLPLKYPFITAITETKNIDGERATSAISASGICKNVLEIVFAPKKSIIEHPKPIIENVISAILKTLCAPLWSPTATLSDISFDNAFGTPIAEIVRSNAYI